MEGALCNEPPNKKENAQTSSHPSVLHQSTQARRGSPAPPMNPEGMVDWHPLEVFGQSTNTQERGAPSD